MQIINISLVIAKFPHKQQNSMTIPVKKEFRHFLIFQKVGTLSIGLSNTHSHRHTL